MKVLLLSILLTAAGPGDESDLRAQTKAKLVSAIKQTKSLTWFQKTWAVKGEEEERTSADCFWTAPDKTRLNVKEGRGAGATAIYSQGKVTGFKPGMFSFVKLTYDVRDEQVLGLRGGDLRDNGFLDDFALVIDQWPSAKLETDAKGIVISYSNRAGLPTKIWLAADTFAPIRIETYENGAAVERAEFSKIVANPALEAELFEP